MPTTLTPDLLAAAETAHRSAQHHERMAAWHLLPHRVQQHGVLTPLGVDQVVLAQATEAAERARADRLEARALLDAAIGDRPRPIPQPSDPPGSEDGWVHPRAER